MNELLWAIIACGAFTAAYNISGQPAASLPAGLSASGLPIGVQIIGPAGKDDRLLRTAHWVQKHIAAVAA